MQRKTPTPLRKKKSKQRVYFEPTGFRNGEAPVLKFLVSDDERWLSHETTYVAKSNGECSCNGNTYRHRCKHVDMVTDDRPGAPLSLVDARREISRLSFWLHTYYIFIDLPVDDPYDLADGKVVCARLIATGVDKRSNCPFPAAGTWRVYMPVTGLKIIVRVVELRGYRDAAPPPYYRGTPH